MNECVAQVIFERSQADWTSPKGVYADYSKGPDRPEFYAKCPKCGLVHGTFPSFQAAVYNKICGACHFDAVNKLKSDIEKVDDPPGPRAKRKRPWPLQVETVLENLLGDDEPDLVDPKEYVHQALENANWVDRAVLDLMSNIEEPLNITDTDYDPEEPDASTVVQMTGRRTGDVFSVYRDESDARAEAEQKVKADIEANPENWSSDFIKQFIDEERLKRAFLSDDYEGRHDPETFDPWEYLHDLYGDDYIREADRIVPVDSARAAEHAIRYDGWAQHLATDGRAIPLLGGGTAVQIR